MTEIFYNTFCQSKVCKVTAVSRYEDWGGVCVCSIVARGWLRRCSIVARRVVEDSKKGQYGCSIWLMLRKNLGTALPWWSYVGAKERCHLAMTTRQEMRPNFPQHTFPEHPHPLLKCASCKIVEYIHQRNYFSYVDIGRLIWFSNLH